MKINDFGRLMTMIYKKKQLTVAVLLMLLNVTLRKSKIYLLRVWRAWMSMKNGRLVSNTRKISAKKTFPETKISFFLFRKKSIKSAPLRD